MSEKHDKKVFKESIQQQDAFEYYYAMGATRKLSLVAEKFSRSEATLKRWSSELGWSRRIEERDRAVAEAARVEIEKSLIESRGAYRSVTRTIFNKLVEQTQQSLMQNKSLPLEIKSIQDLERIIRIDTLMLGTVEDLTKLGLDERKLLKEARMKSVVVLTGLLYSGNENVRLRAAQLLAEQTLDAVPDEEKMLPEFEEMEDEHLINYLMKQINANPQIVREIGEELNQGRTDMVSEGDLLSKSETETGPA